MELSLRSFCIGLEKYVTKQKNPEEISEHLMKLHTLCLKCPMET